MFSILNFVPMKAIESFNIAEKFFDKGDFKESIRLYSQAIELDPQNANYIAQRGVAFFHFGKNEEALYDLDLALKLEPTNPFRYASRAFILSNLNRIDEAISDYKKTIELDPEDSIAYNNLGLLEEKKGYRESAQNNFKKADDLEGIHLRSSNNVKANDQSLKSESKDFEKDLKELSYFQFIRRVISDSKLRKDFYRFIRNGFK